MSNSTRPDAQQLAALNDCLLGALAQRMGVAPTEVDARLSFSRCGLDSLGAVALSRTLSELLGWEVSPTLFWRYPSVDALVRHLTSGEDARAEARRTEPARREEPLAVVGVSCRFPGAPDIEAFWKLLREGVDAVSEVPSDRWKDGRLQSADSAPGVQPVPRRAGFLPDIKGFDPLFFGISPREATEMDPQQRLFLELAWEALEDAGIPPRALHSTDTGVFVGAIWRDYAELAGSEPGRITCHTATGQALNMIANRLSYVLGLQGPSVVVDTACSSSLVAVHQACQSLWSGESAVAIVGGVNLMASPHTMVSLTRFGGLAPDGRCKAFDASADGFGRGEGGGVVILKPLSAAIAAGDSIRGVIRATAVNNDGPSNGLTAPNPEAQEKLLRRAYARAQVELSSVGYIETHGTGTALGDPIEAGALGAVFANARAGGQPLLIGSVKTNMGHLEGAAGIAGLLKALLCVQHRTVVPSLHFERPNPHIPFDALRLEVVRETAAWPLADAPAVAGVSSFGWGGTNAHLVLEEFPRRPLALLRLAASDKDSLLEVAGRARAAARGEQPLEAICEELARTASGSARAAACVRSKAELEHRLEGFLAGGDVQGLTLGKARERPAKVAFVCSPQGGQWVGMGRLLLRSEPAFRAAFARVDAALSVHTGESLQDELFKDEGVARYDDVDVIQPLLFAFQVALAEQWRAWGVTPDAVVGHSLGEIAAAHIAGILDLDDAALVIHHYSRLQKLLAGRGGMAVVELPPEALADLLAAHDGRSVVAAYNGPRSTVLSGDPGVLDQQLSELKARKALCARIRVNVAAHSPQIDEIIAELVSVLAGIRPRRARLPMISTASRRRLEGPEVDGRYFARNLREPVWLSPVIRSLVDDGMDAFVELSPHPVLGAALRQITGEGAAAPLVLSSTRRDDDERWALYESRAALFCLGLPGQGSDTSRDELVPLSAHTPRALRQLAERMAAAVRTQPHLSLEALTSTMTAHRTHHPVRVAVVARQREEVAEALEAFSREATHERLVTASSGKRPSVAFIFPGQGSQWHGMARELLKQEPVFRAEVEKCDAAVRALVDWSVLEELEAPAERSRMDRVDVVQPVLFTVAVALAALWRAWGVEPRAVIGHSMGEVAAAHVAGTLSLEDAARIICGRSQLLRRVSGQGAMLAAELTLEEARQAVKGREALVSVAVSNSSRSSVLSGNREALAAIAEDLERRGVFWRWVKVDVASHSPQMDVLKDDLVKVLEDVKPVAAPVRIFSTVTSTVTDGRDFDATYWVRNLRDPVLFASAIRQARASGLDVFIEMSPHPILLPAIEQELADSGETGDVLPSLRRNESERETMLRSLGALYARGVDVQWSAVTLAAHPPVALPTYPWQRESFWLETAHFQGAPVVASRGAEGLLGTHLPSAVDPTLHHWQTEWSQGTCAFLAGHCVGGDVVVPGAAFLSMALWAARKSTGEDSLVLKGIRFPSALTLQPEVPPRVQTVLTARDGLRGVQVFSLAEGGGWTLHAQVSVESDSGQSGRALAAEASEARVELLRSATLVLEKDLYYEKLEGCGLDYRAGFRGLERVWSNGPLALGRVAVPSDAASPELVQVACIDSALQLAIATLPPEVVARAGLLTSVGLDGFELRDAPGGTFHVYARRRDEQSLEAFAVDVVAFTEGGELLFHAEGLRIRVLAGERPATRGASREGRAASGARALLEELGHLEPSRRPQRAVQELRQVVATVLKLAVERVPVDQPLRSLGMDSVMSLELRNRIEARTGIRLSATALWNHPTLENLARFLLRNLPVASVEPRVPPAEDLPTQDIPLEVLSDLDAAQLLEAELAQVQKMLEES